MHMQTYARVLHQLPPITHTHTVAAAKLLLNASGLKGGNLLRGVEWEEGDLS